MSETERNRFVSARAREELRAHPGTFARSYVEGAGNYVSATGEYITAPMASLRVVAYAIALVLAAVVLIARWRTSSWRVLLDAAFFGWCGARAAHRRRSVAIRRPRAVGMGHGRCRLVFPVVVRRGGGRARLRRVHHRRHRAIAPRSSPLVRCGGAGHRGADDANPRRRHGEALRDGGAVPRLVARARRQQ